MKYHVFKADRRTMDVEILHSSGNLSEVAKKLCDILKDEKGKRKNLSLCEGDRLIPFGENAVKPWTQQIGYSSDFAIGYAIYLRVHNEVSDRAEEAPGSNTFVGMSIIVAADAEIIGDAMNLGVPVVNWGVVLLQDDSSDEVAKAAVEIYLLVGEVCSVPHGIKSSESASRFVADINIAIMNKSAAGVNRAIDELMDGVNKPELVALADSIRTWAAARFSA